MNKDALVLLLTFKNMFYYFWMITLIKNMNNFQIARVLLSICLKFDQFQAGVAYKNFAYKKDV